MRRHRPVRLAVTCPKCFQAPAVRAFPVAIEMAKDLDPDEPVQTVKCQWCGTLYTVTARAFHDAV